MKTLLFKPFEKYSEQKLLITGVIATLIGALVAYVLNCRFVGVFQMIFEDTAIVQSLIDNIIIISCLTTFLFISAKLIYKKTRFIDIFVTAIVSFIPFYILPIFNINDALKESTREISKFAFPDMGIQMPIETLLPLVVFSFFGLFVLVWFIALLYNGFKTAANAKGTKAMVVFGIALVLADITSRYLIFLLN